MKKVCLKAYHFLGGISFAIFLIAATALFVIAGTFIESITGSHRYAELFTYGNPAFNALLYGFFINILFSALRRWPFKVRNIPFLITHFGMLMILAGVLIKNLYGVQGNMIIMEGSASDEIYLADSYALYIETREQADSKTAYIPLTKENLSGKKRKIAQDNFEVELIHYTPHANENQLTWVKGNAVTISGIPPFSLGEWLPPFDTPLPPPVRIPELLDIRGIFTEDPSLLAQKAYAQITKIILIDTLTEKIYFEGSLEALYDGIETPYGFVKGALQWDFQSTPLLSLQIEHPEHSDKIDIALQGSDALFNRNEKSGLGKAPITVDLSSESSLFILKNTQNELTLFAFDKWGRIWNEIHRQGKPGTVFIYDEGYGGYSAQVKIPIGPPSMGRKEKEAQLLHDAAGQLQEGLQINEDLSPPLQLLRTACEKSKADFSKTTIEFLAYWDKTGSWLIPADLALPKILENSIGLIDWNTVPNSIYKGCWWNAALFDRLDPLLKKRADLMEVLQEGKWPLISSLQASSPCLPHEWLPLLTVVTQQMFSVADQLPEAPQVDSPTWKARLLSAYLRAAEIHPSQILSIAHNREEERQPVVLECPIQAVHIAAEPLKKLEENTPAILVKISRDNIHSVHSLGYDRLGTGMKGPALQGTALVRFQPLYRKIPYRLRLREARQINYANSQQPYSYECDLLITETRQNSVVEKTISMNNVHETLDGYRFYLANIYPPGEGEVKRVQIAVNHDPAKYYLTYPGAMIMCLGIVLLFWMMKSSKGS